MAQAFAGVNLDNRAIPGVYIGIVMGRHAGFLTAASVLGKNTRMTGRTVYLPERPFNKQFVQDVQASTRTAAALCRVRGHRRHQRRRDRVAVTGGEKDSHGNVQLSGATGRLLASWIKAETGIKRVRADTLSYLQQLPRMREQKSTSSRRAKSAKAAGSRLTRRRDARW